MSQRVGNDNVLKDILGNGSEDGLSDLEYAQRPLDNQETDDAGIRTKHELGDRHRDRSPSRTTQAFSGRQPERGYRSVGGESRPAPRRQSGYYSPYSASDVYQHRPPGRRPNLSHSPSEGAYPLSRGYNYERYHPGRRMPYYPAEDYYEDPRGRSTFGPREDHRLERKRHYEDDLEHRGVMIDSTPPERRDYAMERQVKRWKEEQPRNLLKAASAPENSPRPPFEEAEVQPKFKPIVFDLDTKTRRIVSEARSDVTAYFVARCNFYDMFAKSKREQYWRAPTYIVRPVEEALRRCDQLRLLFSVHGSQYYQGIAEVDRRREIEYPSGNERLARLPLRWVIIADVPYGAIPPIPGLMTEHGLKESFEIPPEYGGHLLPIFQKFKAMDPTA